MFKSKETTYESAGVNIDVGEACVNRIKSMVRSTFNNNVLSDIGLFGGFLELDTKRYKKPVLVSSIDGVGTKLKIAFAMNVHNTIGEDLVNHCVNDVMTSGADPLFFLDYLAVNRLTPDVLEKIIEGMAQGCRNAGCALIGGETAEMPGFYQLGEYDVAGTIVGIVEREHIINGEQIKKDDVLVGLASNGLHTNGYSLARKVLLEVAKFKVTDYIEELGHTIGEELLRVHRSYADAVTIARQFTTLKGIVHVTGGGIEGNTKRLLPAGRSLIIEWSKIDILPIFKIIQKLGNISDTEMRRVFNLGVGEIFIISPEEYDELYKRLKSLDSKQFFMGVVQ